MPLPGVRETLQSFLGLIYQQVQIRLKYVIYIGIFSDSYPLQPVSKPLSVCF